KGQYSRKSFTTHSPAHQKCAQHSGTNAFATVHGGTAVLITIGRDVARQWGLAVQRVLIDARRVKIRHGSSFSSGKRAWSKENLLANSGFPATLMPFAG